MPETGSPKCRFYGSKITFFRRFCTSTFFGVIGRENIAKSLTVSNFVVRFLMSEITVIMKNFIPILASIACIFSMDCIAQRLENGPANMDIDNAQLLSDNMKNGDL